MGKENLLVDRQFLVGVSKQERISGPRNALDHASLRTTYMTDEDAATDPIALQAQGDMGPSQRMDFFRGSGARYYSFKTGDQPSNYNNFGYLNKTGYAGTEDRWDVAQLNDNNVENYIAFTIGDLAPGRHQGDYAAANRGNATKPSSEWLHEERGWTTAWGFVFNTTIANLAPWAAGSIEVPGDDRPWKGIVPIWPFLGYPDTGTPGSSLPGPYRDPHGNYIGGSWNAHRYDGTDYSPWPINSCARKTYILTNSHPPTWNSLQIYAAGSAGVINTTMSSQVWGTYWGFTHDQSLLIYQQDSSGNPITPADAGYPEDWADSTGVRYRGFIHQWAAAGHRVNDYHQTNPPGHYPHGWWFEDHAHKFFTPYGIDDPICKVSSIGALKTAKIEPQYNYFYKNYEVATGPALSGGMDPHETVLPNVYMIYDYVEKALDGGDDAYEMRQAYRKLNCLGQAGGIHFGGWLPPNSSSIAELGYKPGGNNSTQPKRSYIQHYARKLKNEEYGLASLSKIQKINGHIGFSKDMVENDFPKHNEAPVPIPFSIAIEFDTDMPGDDTTFIDILEAREGAFDFIINNIILMNLDDWDEGVCDSIPYDTFNETIEFSTQIKEQEPWTDPTTGTVSSTDSYSYFGFDWVNPPAAGTTAATDHRWGYNDAGGLAAGAGHENKGDDVLRCLDIGKMFDYANLSSKLPKWPANNPPAGDMSQVRGPNEGKVDGESVRCPIVGQIAAGSHGAGRGIAFDRGILVGAKAMPGHTWAESDPLRYKSPKWIYDNADNNNKTLKDPTWQSLAAAFAARIHQKSRSYLEMINGDTAHTETLAFKVEKYVADEDGTVPDTRAPVQNFYFPNVSAVDKLKYVDTQVKYGVKYKYIVYAYNLVIGNQYCYQNIPQGIGPAADDAADPGNGAPPVYFKPFYAHQFISAKIIEAPYYEFDAVQVRDLPPVFPEIETVPFKGINNKIRFLMQTQNVKYAFNPGDVTNSNGEGAFIIKPEDRAKHAIQRDYQQRPTGPIVFGSDDSEIIFEIYRMTEKPTSYADFADHHRATVEGILPSGQRAVNLGFDDDIKPNTKYYYTFRCIDYHGGLSIPSPIYHVEIVDDNGRMFPIVGVFYISNHVDLIKKTYKPFRKYLQLGASFAQKIVDDTILQARFPSLDPGSKNGLAGLLGTSVGKSAWFSENTTKKTFKIRITSKSTGKKLDLNVRLKEVPIINPSEQS